MSTRCIFNVQQITIPKKLVQNLNSLKKLYTCLFKITKIYHFMIFSRILTIHSKLNWKWKWKELTHYLKFNFDEIIQLELFCHGILIIFVLFFKC